MSDGGRQAELDGVRGVAILLVLVGHADYRLAPLAAAGVALFFTLSGYLITGLLLAEREKHGGLRLLRFYVRRFTRLAPPLFVMLAVMGVALGASWGLVFPSMLWVSNYVGPFGANVTPFGHTWSLAVEEQFYLVWPAALLVLLRRRAPARVLMAVMAGLTAWWALLIAAGHLEHAYSSLETAGVPILGGCLVALRGRRKPRHAVEPFAALLLLTAVLSAADLPGAWLGVPMLTVPLTLALVAAAQGSRWLSWRPLTFCGVASYSLYLWHLPVAWLVGDERLGIALGALVGLLAYAVVERPLMAWRSRERVPSVVAQAPEPALL